MICNPRLQVILSWLKVSRWCHQPNCMPYSNGSPNHQAIAGEDDQTHTTTSCSCVIRKDQGPLAFMIWPMLHAVVSQTTRYNQCEEPNAWRVVVNLLQNNPHQDTYCPTIGRLVASSSSVQLFCFWSLLMPVLAEHVISSWSSAPTRLLEGFW